jgi:ankyrin repeat protein
MKNTLLHIASQRGNLDIIRLLLNHNINIDAQNNRGEPPLWYAKDVNIFRFLLEQGADYKIRNYKEQTFKEFVTECIQNSQYRTLQMDDLQAMVEFLQEWEILPDIKEPEENN